VGLNTREWGRSVMKVYNILPMSQSLPKASLSVFKLVVYFQIGVMEIPHPNMFIHLYIQLQEMLHVKNCAKAA